MSKNNQKSDNFLKIALIICTVGISSILIVLMFIFCKDRFTSYDDYKYNYSLRPGYYEVGVDLPASTYVVELGEGKEAEFSIYKDQGSCIAFQRRYYVYDNEKGGKDILKLPYGGIGISGIRKVPIKKRVNSIELKEGQFLKIEAQTSLVFYTNDIEDINSDVIQVTQIEVPVSSYRATAAQDFPAGVYDIVYIPNDSNQSGTIQCQLKDVEANYSANGYSFECVGLNRTQVIARGIPFTPGSSITLTNVDGVTLVATERIVKTFNSITWEAN